jgi:hypothetical protein
MIIAVMMVKPIMDAKELATATRVVIRLSLEDVDGAELDDAVDDDADAADGTIVYYDELASLAHQVPVIPHRTQKKIGKLDQL